MRTSTLIASLTSSLALALGASALASDPTGISVEEELLRQVERDLSHFVCGTPDAQKEEEKPVDGSSADPAQIGIFDDAFITNYADHLQRLGDLNTTEPDSPADDLSDPDIEPAAAHANQTDITGDGAVNIDDILMVLQNWGTCSPWSTNQCIGDVNGDGYVDERDLLLILMNWN